jgi:hypothetical protein
LGYQGVDAMVIRYDKSQEMECEDVYWIQLACNIMFPHYCVITNFPGGRRETVLLEYLIMWYDKVVLCYLTTYFNCVGYIVLNRRMTVKCDAVTVWEKAVVTYFVILSQHLPGQTEENHEVSQQGQPNVYRTQLA